MGRKAAVSKNEIFKVLIKLDIFHSNGQLKTELNPVWEEACMLLKNKIKRTNLYLFVLQNRHGILETLKNKKFGHDQEIHSIKDDDFQSIIDPANHLYSVSDNTSDELEDSFESSLESTGDEEDKYCIDKINSFTNPNPQNCEPLNFTIQLNEDNWKIIKPVNCKLPKYIWTPVIAKHIWNEKKIPCPYRFKVGKVYKTSTEKYFDFHGRCKETDKCGAYIYGVCKKKPENDSDGIRLNLQTFDTRHIKHTKKRHLSHFERKKAKESLKYVTACKYKHDLVNDVMEDSDVEPPFLCNTFTYRKVREQAVNEDLDLKGPKNIIKSLIFIKKNNPVIKEVCTIPFRVWYWYPGQINIWNELAATNPIILLDATGSVVKKVTMNGETCSDVFLYQLLSWIGKRYVPLCQMISSRQDTNVITYWLNKWKACIKDYPKESITDGSLALLNAISSTFNNCSYKCYLQICFDYLQGNCSELPFTCFIRLDRAHLIKAVTRWKCFSDKNVIVKDFYTRTIALAVTATNLHDLEELILSTFIISESKVMQENTTCYSKYNSLIERFKNFKCDNYDRNNNRNEIIEIENTEIDIQELSNNKITEYLQNIYNKSVKLANTKEDLSYMPNEMYCPKIKDNLMYIYSQFPSWTRIMQKAFNSPNDDASSARNESYFKDLFNIHGISHPLSANKFILQHTKIIKSQTLLAKSELKKLKIDCNKEIQEEKPNICYQSQEQTSAFSKSSLNNEIFLEKLDVENQPQRFNDHINIDNVKTNKIKEKILYKDDKKMKFTGNVKIKKERYSENLTIAEIPLVHNTFNKDICDLEKKSTAVEVSKIVGNDSKQNKKNNYVLINCKNTILLNSHLKNGNLITDPINLHGKMYYFRNTCAFDSICELLFFAYTYSDSFKQSVNAASTLQFSIFHIVKNYFDKSFRNIIYFHRALLLLPYAKKTDICTYDCTSNVVSLFERLLKQLFSVQCAVECRNCGHKRLDNSYVLTVAPSIANDLVEKNSQKNFIEKCIISTLQKEVINCRKCKQITALCKKKIENFLAVDVEDVFATHTINVDNIPISIEHEENTLNLSGLIAFAGKGLLHYFTYCYHKDRNVWEIKDDLKDSSEFVPTISKNLKIALIMYNK